MCELHLHGSKAIIRTILKVLGEFVDTKRAENGEFTKRAFLNHKLSLIEAEAINELINSEFDSQRRTALNGLNENIVNMYNKWRLELIKLLAYIQADIEFGEDQLLDEERIDKTIQNIFKIRDEILNFLKISSKKRHIINDGLNCCIVGSPNVGKSSLMNTLCDKELSIVSPYQGTTRDVIETKLEISGYQLKLNDTAGIRNLNNSNENFVENLGIKKALEKAKNADILIHLVDVSKLDVQENLLKNNILYLNNELIKFSTNLSNNTIHILNKIDLINLELRNQLIDLFKNSNNVLLFSCETKENLINLINLISNLINKQINRPDQENSKDDFITERHEIHLKRIVDNINLAMEIINDDRSISAYYIENSINEIASITGVITNEQILDIIFKDFCIGK